jgi:hypothetical protein
MLELYIQKYMKMPFKVYFKLMTHFCRWNKAAGLITLNLGAKNWPQFIWAPTLIGLLSPTMQVN